ncbi:MAG TPA: hypothetical protein DDW76_24540 [Cyanobacteria bacterium UBA11369]|nr:hypothetical protein [Cyanobacteria bacterium UBA8543]HAZ46236.1 hypothetical protein [Cyanobacteria bacterium UBA11371]HBE36514.1 hypothetical protein [Cyanobacteria bacterium UBA11368]HBE51854.1 hypothetical protein [Cyanobacteria bacterium UBA11369]
MNKKPKARVSILPGFEMQFTREETQGLRNKGGGEDVNRGINRFGSRLREEGTARVWSDTRNAIGFDLGRGTRRNTRPPLASNRIFLHSHSQGFGGESDRGYRST